MILIVLEVNGVVRWRLCKNEDEARFLAKLWLDAARRDYPHKDFTPRYFKAEEL